MRVKVLNLDGVPDADGDAFTSRNVSFQPRTRRVPVTLEFDIGKIVGAAVLSVEDDGLYAEIEWSPAWPQFTPRGLTPGVQGIRQEDEAGVVSYSIIGVGLHRRANTDPRIERL